jgi:hypothetical protein
LTIYDRGYPATSLIEEHEANKTKYLMRVSTSFFKEVNEAKENDQIVQVHGKELKIRVIKIVLDTGEIETLITNVYDEISYEEFKALYFKRWEIEVKYSQLKGKLQLENFTSETELGITQDFYASMYLINMAALAKQAANYDLDIKNSGKNLEYKYKANTNILIGKLKDNLVLMIVIDDVKKREEIFDYIMRKLMQNATQIRNDRHNLRNIKAARPLKYPMNSKKCL